MAMTFAKSGLTPFAVSLRGGRMTKWRGIVASVAVATMAIPADAACTNNGGGSFDCASSETTQQTLTGAGVPLNVIARAGQTFNVTASGQSAFILSTTGSSLTFTQEAAGGLISGAGSGLRATNNGTGMMALTTTGAVSAGSGAGIFTVATGGSGMTINATDVTGFVHGINLNNDLGSSGAVTVTVTGSATGTRVPVNASTNSTGITVNQVGGGTDITITANDVTGGTYGIVANNQSLATGGNTTVNANGTISGGSGSPVGNSAAIYATHANSGALQINLNGSATSATGYGILATTTSAGTTTTINANDISAAMDGMNLTHAGTGPLSVTVSGDVAGGTGAGITNTSASKGGTFTVTSSGSLQATSGVAFNDASNGTAGSANSTLDMSGNLNGDATMGTGADTITLRTGATLASGALLDGDAGAASFTTGQVDTLNFAGWSGFIDGAQIANQEQLNLSGSADVTFTGSSLANANVTDGLTVQTGASAIARFASSFTVSGNMTNMGALDLSSRNGVAGTALTIGGNYAGGGQFVIDVDFAADIADQLLVSGTVSGATFVIVNDVSSGLASGNNVVFATVGGTTSAGNFQLAGGPISAGAYNYDTQLVGSQWVLGAVAAPGPTPGPALNATAALYESTPDILLGAFASAPTYHQRIDQRQWLTHDNAAGTGFQGFWMRSAGDWADITPQQSSSGASYDRDSVTLQAGADFNLGAWVLGVAARYGSVDADITNAMGSGSLSGHGYGIGATATWNGESGSYLDLQGGANWISADLETASTGFLLNNADMRAYSASAEAGHRFALDEDHYLIPQTQLSWGKLDAGRYVDSQSSVVDLGNPDSLIGRVGLAYEVVNAGADGRGSFYAVGNLLHDFSGTRTVDLAGTTLTSKNVGTWAEVGVGGAVSVGRGASFYAEGSYRSALGDGSLSAYSLNVGFRKAF